MERSTQILEMLEAQMLALPVQVHEDQIWQVDEPERISVSRGPKADVALTQNSKVGVGVLTADCVPILIASTDGKIVAAVHGGWRGLYAGIVSTTIQRICVLAQTHPANLLVSVGPAIGQAAFEVDLELAERFENRYPDYQPHVRKTKEKAYLSLADMARQQALDSGVIKTRSEILRYCTHERSDLFYSYRRTSGCAGRQLSAISLGWKTRDKV